MAVSLELVLIDTPPRKSFPAIIAVVLSIAASSSGLKSIVSSFKLEEHFVEQFEVVSCFSNRDCKIALYNFKVKEIDRIYSVKPSCQTQSVMPVYALFFKHLNHLKFFQFSLCMRIESFQYYARGRGDVPLAATAVKDVIGFIVAAVL